MTYEPKQVEVFQNLFLRGPAKSQPALRQALLDHVAGPWCHAEEIEKKLSTLPGWSAGRPGSASGENGADILAFDRDTSDGLPAATLWLSSQSDGYKVTNIIPSETGQLDYSEYNAILEDFGQRVASRAAQQVGFQIETTSSRQSIEDWLPQKAAEALRRFSRYANKSTGSAHPSDREHWFKFLITAHSDKGQLDTELLARWLVEVEGWSDDRADKLAIEYEFGLGLLSEYDHHHP